MNSLNRQSTFKKMIIVFLSLISSGANAQSIAFQDNLIVNTTKSKLVYIDVYADWCMPCKKMAEECFSDPEISQFFNDNFESYQIDGESDLGRKINELYDIKGYPTSLFLDRNMNLIQNVLGYKGRDSFLENAQHVVGNYNADIFENVEHNDLNDLYDQILKMDSLNFDNRASVNIYLNKIPENDYKKDLNQDLIFKHFASLDPQQRTFDYVMRNIKDLVQDTLRINRYMLDRSGIDMRTEFVFYNYTRSILAKLLNKAHINRDAKIFDQYKKYYSDLSTISAKENKFAYKRALFLTDIDFYKIEPDLKLDSIIKNFSEFLLSQFTPESLLEHNATIYNRAKERIISADPNFEFTDDAEKVLNKVLNEYIADLNLCISLIKDENIKSNLSLFLNDITIDTTDKVTIRKIGKGMDMDTKRAHIFTPLMINQDV